jgi:hypothetical protein
MVVEAIRCKPPASLGKTLAYFELGKTTPQLELEGLVVLSV